MTRTLEEMICQNCNQPYTRNTGTNSKAKYCSVECYRTIQKLNANPKPNRLAIQKLCQICSTPFHPIRGRGATQKYCSAKCRDIASREPIRQMSEAEIAWLAGLFDGEGHIGVNTTLSPRAKGVKIQITNTCRELVDKIIQVTGIGFITTRYHENERHKPTYDWHTTGGNAKELIRLMYPWLIAKRPKALIVLTS